MERLKQILSRLKSPATVMGIVGYVVTILLTSGVNVDQNAITTIAQSACGILILLGIMNNPDDTEKFL